MLVDDAVSRITANVLATILAIGAPPCCTPTCSTRDSSADASPPTAAPTHARYGVLGFLCSLSFVLYLDRVCIGQAVVPIQNDLGLSKTQIGYALGGVHDRLWAVRSADRPLGRSLWLARRADADRRVVVAVHGADRRRHGLLMLVAVRFLFGAGEAGAYPNAARVIARWFPLGERGARRASMLTSAQLGAALAPVHGGLPDRRDRLAVDVRRVQRAGRRVGGGCSIVWFRDDPAEHPRANAAERALIAAGQSPTPQAEHHPPIPWRAILTNRNIWLLGTLQTCSSFVSYMYMSWYPTYLRTGRGGRPARSRLAVVAGAGRRGGRLPGQRIHQRLAGAASRTIIRPGFAFMDSAGTAIVGRGAVVSVQCESPLATSLWAARGVHGRHLAAGHVLGRDHRDQRQAPGRRFSG